MMIAKVFPMIACKKDHRIVVHAFFLEQINNFAYSIINLRNCPIVVCHNTAELYLAHLIIIHNSAVCRRIAIKRMRCISGRQSQTLRIVHFAVGIRRVKGMMRFYISNHQ